MKKETEILPGQLPIERGKTYINRVLSVYINLFHDKYGFNPTVSIGKFGKLLKELIKTHTEYQISAMMIIFFNWAGMNGEDKLQRDRLVQATHNFGWFFSTVNNYEVYIRNVYELDFNNEDKVREFVNQSLLELK